MENLYAELYTKRIFTLNEAIQTAQKLTSEKHTRSYISSKYLNPLVKSGKLVKPRRGLFIAAPPSGEYSVDKLLLASKIRENGFLGFHSALEYYGCAYSATNEAYICVEPRHRFKDFSFDGYSFKPVYVKDAGFEVTQHEYRGHQIRVSGRERLLLDCVSRPKYAGGWEECLKSLEGLGGLDFERLANILEGGYGGQTVIRRAGLVLEILRGSSVFYRHLQEEALTRVERLVEGGRRYLTPRSEGHLVKRWGLIVPDDFRGFLRAV